MYTSSEQVPAPTCGVCGKKLGIGYYFTCHVCSQSFCYAHIPQKCNHVKPKLSSVKVSPLR